LHPALSVTGGTFDYNLGKLGGAINWSGGSITVANALFKGNQAQSGSAIYARGLETGKSSIANTLVVESVSKAEGSAIDLERASLFNATIAKNGSAGIKFMNSGADTEIINSITRKVHGFFNSGDNDGLQVVKCLLSETVGTAFF
jgi:predicted outer membrane repeat protein